MMEVNGSRYSGSGAIVRQSVALAALTGQPAHVVNARTRRPQPGLRPQHARAVEAIRHLVGGSTQNVEVGATEFVFRPGERSAERRFTWDIGTAGSTTLLAMALLPVLAFWPGRVSAELRGGLFQDFAPSIYHFRHALLPMLRTIGLDAVAEMHRPGYNPRGGGVLHLTVGPVDGAQGGIALDHTLPVERVWRIALASRLTEQGVTRRMDDAAADVLAAAGHRARIECRDEVTSLQPGAALALFADLKGGPTIGADRAGARGRRAEEIGKRVAGDLLADLSTGATLDRFLADQVVTFAALADGESRFLVPEVTGHIESNAWLVHLDPRQPLLNDIPSARLC